ncbi:hypothetical protein [Streptomyces sp. NPDC091209]|uniref:hypothetical protein n=1 Tax=Streptomyces sp. NPDC091209 TaxID=3365974 RepID=UPI0037FDDA54
MPRPLIRALVDADRTARSRALLRHGVDGLLHSLRPTVDWSPSVLTAPDPVDRDLHLAGRGLLLVPSVFGRPTPVTLVDAALLHANTCPDRPPRRPLGSRPAHPPTGDKPQAAT